MFITCVIIGLFDEWCVCHVVCVVCLVISTWMSLENILEKCFELYSVQKTEKENKFYKIVWL